MYMIRPLLMITQSRWAVCECESAEDAAALVKAIYIIDRERKREIHLSCM